MNVFSHCSDAALHIRVIPLSAGIILSIWSEHRLRASCRLMGVFFPHKEMNNNDNINISINIMTGYFHLQVENFFKGLVATFKALLRQESCIEIGLFCRFVFPISHIIKYTNACLFCVVNLTLFADCILF